MGKHKLNSYQSYQSHSRLRPLIAFGYYGSKIRLSEQIVGLFDYRSTSVYLEPFGGSAATMINKPPHGKEIYAEKSLYLCCFWRCMSEKGAAYELIEVADRFYGVEVIHADAFALLQSSRFDSPEAMIYLDPVYLPEAGRKRSYNHTLYKNYIDYSGHIKLLEQIRTMNSRIIISGYDDDTSLYNRYLIEGEGLSKGGNNFKPWHRYEIESVSTVARGDKKRVEVLWANYD